MTSLKINSYYILDLDNGDRILGKFDKQMGKLYFFEIIGNKYHDWLGLSQDELKYRVKLKKIRLNKRFVDLFI